MMLRHCFALLTITWIASLVACSVCAAEPVSIIFDTDVDHDCDDIGALYILHGAVQRGEAKLLGTMGCTSSDDIAPCLEAINTWFGRPDVPVGTLKDQGFLDHKGFAAELIQRYPSKFTSGKDYPDALVLYRQILANQPDGSVVVLAVGPLRNISNLLKSGPDEASPLEGRELVAQKVKRLEVMGGNYPPHNAKEAEWNFKQDPAAAAHVCSAWPTPVLFNGEGGSTSTGRRVTYEMPEHNPLTMAYRLYPGVGYAGDRLSWDSVSAFVAVRGAAPWYEVVSGGTNVSDPTTGANTWREDKHGKHSYLVLKSRKPELERAIEDMQTLGKGRPRNLKFNTIQYADAGMCLVTHSGERDKDGVIHDRAASSWIQYQHSDGRKHLVTSYALECKNEYLLPRGVELYGSNDGQTWTQLDAQEKPGFSAQEPRRQFHIGKPSKWNMYKLTVSAADEREGVRIDSVELLNAIDCVPSVRVASISMDHAALTLPVHGRSTINATISPSSAFEREVAWETSDAEVASVRRIGEQTAIVIGKKTGTCTITAMIDGRKQICDVTVTPSSLPESWSYDELNAPPIPGSVLVAKGRFIVTGCGHAMTSWWERVRDQGVFVSKSTSGDVELSAQLTGLAPNVGGPSYKWDHRPPSAAGLMIRESRAEACSRYFLIQVDASGTLIARWRDKTGDQDDNQSKELGKVTLPIHLKLVQRGKELQVFTSEDGKNWGEPRFSNTAPFPEGSRFGLFVCSGNTFASTTATFGDVIAKSHK
jgi:hypothetical protein